MIDVELCAYQQNYYITYHLLTTVLHITRHIVYYQQYYITHLTLHYILTAVKEYITYYVCL